jgi:hypothetical protein
MIAYNRTWLTNLNIVKEAQRWMKEGIITKDDYTAISQAHPSSFYHPNFIIRILLFLATLIAMGGVTGLLGLMLADIIEDVIEVVSLLYGLGSWIFLEAVFIKNGRHYKSGVNEAILYHSIGWTIGGLVAMSDFNEDVITLTCLVVFSAAAIRYADLISTIAAFISLCYLIVHQLYSAGEASQQIIPLVFIVLFTPAYFVIRKIKQKNTVSPWSDVIVLTEAMTLIVIYAAGNYFVVRELSESMLGFYIEEGQDIPFAFLFYSLTVIIPIAYLYFGIREKDVVLLRVSLAALAFSVFTFKYYFSLGHPEITLTLAGAILMTISLYLFRLLKTPRNGFTQENLLKEKWMAANPEAFIISQTLGGNKISVDQPADLGGGGQVGGGGSSDSW